MTLFYKRSHKNGYKRGNEKILSKNWRRDE